MDFWNLSEANLNQNEESKVPMPKAKQLRILLNIPQLPISKAKLRVLVSIPPIYTFIQEGDFAFYQTLLQIMIPEVLRPIPPPSLTQLIQNFVKSLECLRITAMSDDDCPTVRLITVEKASLTIQPFSGNNKNKTFNSLVFLSKPSKIYLPQPGCTSESTTNYTNAGRPQQSGLPQNVPSHKFD